MTDYHGSLDFRITHDTLEETTAEMPIAPGMLNPFGTVHAGALTWFADVTATTLALQGRALSPGMSGFPLATNLNVQLLGNRADGTLTATARFVKRGRTLVVVRTEVRAADGALLLELTSTHLMSR